MEARLSQLKRDFHAKLNNAGGKTADTATIALLTREELLELESVWIQLSIWKQQNPSHN